MILSKLKQLGQVLSSDLASHCGVTERTVNEALYPHIANNEVMACSVIKGGKKSIEYRLTGTIPRSRPGPKVGARA